MARILTGIKSTGSTHLGNMLGAILPAIELAHQAEHEAYLFIADFHALTTIHNGDDLRQHAYYTAVSWLACGLDTDQAVFYRQSDVPETTELAWYLACFMPYSRLRLAHTYKDMQDQPDKINGGILTYPILMAADILLYDANLVPVGKDQKQHLEFTRDMAAAINHSYGENTLVLPEARIDQAVMTIPGIDGRKMSKSYDNTLNIFEPDKKLRKRVMQIVTDSTPMEAPKNPDTCNVFRLYELLATEAETAAMRQNYLQGDYGYGHAKTALYELILRRFAKEREAFNTYMGDLGLVDQKLAEGAEKARELAHQVLDRVRTRLGYHARY